MNNLNIKNKTMKNAILILFVLISTIGFSQEPTKELIKKYDVLVKQLNPIDSTLKSMYLNDSKSDSVLVITQKKLEQPYQYSVKNGNKMYPAIKEMYTEEQKWVLNPATQEGFLRWLNDQRNKKEEVKK